MDLDFDDIIFGDTIDMFGPNINVDIYPIASLNEIAGLSELNMKYPYYKDDFFVYYYGIYNVEKKDFFVEICVDFSKSEKVLKKQYPDIINKLLEYKSDDDVTHILKLTEEQKDIIFTSFISNVRTDFIINAKKFNLTMEEAVKLSFDDIIKLAYIDPSQQLPKLSSENQIKDIQER
jgi:hypothetical protein